MSRFAFTLWLCYGRYRVSQIIVQYFVGGVVDKIVCDKLFDNILDDWIEYANVNLTEEVIW